MSEGRITDIMRQTTRRNHRWQFIFIKLPELLSITGISIRQGIPHRLSKGTADRGYFEAMGKSVMHEHRSRKRKHLRLILQPAESGRKDDPVIIPEKGGAHTRIRCSRKGTGR